jgi:hypothetical protein
MDRFRTEEMNDTLQTTPVESDLLHFDLKDGGAPGN